MFDKVIAEFVSLQVIGPFVCDNSSASVCNVEGKNITQSQNASISTVLLGEDSFLKALPFQTVYYVTEKSGGKLESSVHFVYRCSTFFRSYFSYLYFPEYFFQFSEISFFAECDASQLHRTFWMFSQQLPVFSTAHL
jgi:hypothetical protein